MRHRHHWTEVSRTFTPPLDRYLKLERGGTIELLREWTFGFTVVEVRCDECGDLKHHRVIGKASV